MSKKERNELAKQIVGVCNEFTRTKAEKIVRSLLEEVLTK